MEDDKKEGAMAAALAGRGEGLEAGDQEARQATSEQQATGRGGEKRERRERRGAPPMGRLVVFSGGTAFNALARYVERYGM